MPANIDNQSTGVKPLLDLEGDPVFSEPWQAQALAIADSLVRSGRLTANDWSSALGKELEQAKQAGAADNQETYYQSVLAALETLTVEKMSLTGKEIDKRTHQWKEAYLSTPHGKPVLLD